MARASVTRLLTCSRRLLSASSSITLPPPAAATTRSTSSLRLRCYCSGNSRRHPSTMVSTMGDWSLTEMASIYRGMDYKHCEEAAKKKIYKVNCVPVKTHLGFGCEVDWETAVELRELPNVSCVSADFYRDAQYKDYGGELFVDGKIVQRSPERERRVGCFSMTEAETVTEQEKCPSVDSDVYFEIDQELEDKEEGRNVN